MSLKVFQLIYKPIILGFSKALHAASVLNRWSLSKFPMSLQALLARSSPKLSWNEGSLHLEVSLTYAGNFRYNFSYASFCFDSLTLSRTLLSSRTSRKYLTIPRHAEVLFFALFSRTYNIITFVLEPFLKYISIFYQIGSSLRRIGYGFGLHSFISAIFCKWKYGIGNEVFHM